MSHEQPLTKNFPLQDQLFQGKKTEVNPWKVYQTGSISLSSQFQPAEARLTVDTPVVEPATRSRPIADTAAVAPAKRPGTETTDDSGVPTYIQRMLDILKEGGMVKTMPSPPLNFFDEPRFPAFGGLLNEPWTEEPDNIGAFDTDWERAYVRSLGEAIERSCQSHPRERFHGALRGNYHDLQDRAFDPVPFFPFSDDGDHVGRIREKEFLWTPAVHYQSHKENLLPMRLSYLHGCRSDKIFDSIRTTNGTAMWSTLEGAVFRGLCELIERDAFFIHYLGRITPPRIDSTAFTGEIEDMVRYMEKYRLEVCLFDISLEFDLPVVLCVLIDRTGIGPAMAIGTNCTIKSCDAIKGAILEAVQIRRFSRVIKLKNEGGEPLGMFEKRAMDWYGLESMELMDFILNSKELSNPVGYSRTEKEFLDGFPLDLYYSDVTLPGMEEFKVVKVNVPELLPLYFSDEHKPIFGRRVQGYLGDRIINDVPHPFL